MDAADRDWTGRRFGLLATGMLSLLGGLWAGLLRMGWAGPLLHTALPSAHGPLMVCGFLGTVICLERAVALDRAGAFLAPACTGVGGVLTLVGVGGHLGPLLITGGSLGLVAIFGIVLSVQWAPFSLVMASGAGAWAVGNGLWLSGWPVPLLVPWWMGFLVLTIVGERLELSRLLNHGPWTQRLVLGLAALLGSGLLLSVTAPSTGMRVMSAAMIGLALWLTICDMARRTVRTEGLPRFTALCLLIGYGWLAVGGGLGLLAGNPGAGLVYDALLHAVFVGFVFSMIFGHAPIIIPSVLGITLSYRPLFYLPVGLLHLSLVARTIGDLTGLSALRMAGGWGNAGAICLFLGGLVYAARGPGKSPSPPLHTATNPNSAASAPDDLPDLQLEAD